MNILPLAKEHCANYQSGICTGVDIQLDGTAVRFLPEGSSCLVSQGQPCRYFKESVLPMEKWDWKNPAEGRAFQGAAHHLRPQVSLAVLVVSSVLANQEARLTMADKNAGKLLICYSIYSHWGGSR